MRAEDREVAIEIHQLRAREQRLAEAIAQGPTPDAPPEALLQLLTTEQEHRVALERDLALVSQAAAEIDVDPARLERRLRERAADVRTVLLRQLPQGREVLRALLVDRLTFTPIGAAGIRGYRFVGQAAYGGLLAGTAWPTTDGGPNGIRTRVWSRSRFRQHYHVLFSRRPSRKVTRLKHAERTSRLCRPAGADCHHRRP